MKNSNLVQVFSLIMMILASFSCHKNSSSETSQIPWINQETIPEDSPLAFKKDIIPNGKLAHAGVFSPDMTEYYLTISDSLFTHFTVKVVKYENGEWSKPEDAFFNTPYNEHGVHFSPDGQWLFFSSTRPTGKTGFPETWHIWRCRKTRIGWSTPALIDIPGMEASLVSHPSTTTDGQMYFHAANIDYSNMGIYKCEVTARTVSKATKVDLASGFNRYACTPYISPDESFLIFAEINEEEELFITHRKDSNTWTIPNKLNAEINSGNLGNPFITPDQEFLFFAATNQSDWIIKWASAKSILEK